MLVLVFIGGTIYGIFNQTNLKNQSQGDSLKNEDRTEGQIFTGIGQLRISTADMPPGIVILFISFRYYPDDKAFSEELVFRIKNFRNIIEDYFSSFSVSDVQVMEEDKIKAELLRLFNAVLRLGQIEALFISDFTVLG
jgi:flagellar basal body-associated protein FliL